MKVYLLINEENRYKIGYTDRTTQKRIKELQTGSPSEMRVIQEYESDNAKQIETILHRLHKSKRISGEWFALTNEEVLDFKNSCSKIDYNINFLKENKI